LFSGVDGEWKRYFFILSRPPVPSMYTWKC
jgi:hypothetical protein